MDTPLDEASVSSPLTGAQVIWIFSDSAATGLGDRPVRRINQYAFFELGSAINALKELADEPTRLAAWSPLDTAESQLRRLLSGSVMEISFSQHDAKALFEDVERIHKRHFYDDKGAFDTSRDWQVKISSWEIRGLKMAVEKFEHTLSAELRQAATYYIPRIGIYDTPKLIDFAEQHIDDQLRARMNEMAVKDFHDAGRCLAFNLPTASGFHAARAVEGTLADYFQAFADPDADIPGHGTMGDYLQALEKIEESRRLPVPDEKTLRTLREIAKLDRNPVMHPRETLDDQEAGIFFNLATGAITAMLREMKSLPVRPPHIVHDASLEGDIPF